MAENRKPLSPGEESLVFRDKVHETSVYIGDVRSSDVASDRVPTESTSKILEKLDSEPTLEHPKVIAPHNNAKIVTRGVKVDRDKDPSETVTRDA